MNSSNANVDYMHPAVAKDQINDTQLTQELGSVSPLPVKKRPIQEDCYPAGIRAIENFGTAQQVASLHAMERNEQEQQTQPTVDYMHPGKARDQINHTHFTDALGNLGTRQPMAESIKDDLYPAGVRAIENFGSVEQRAELHKMEHSFSQ